MHRNDLILLTPEELLKHCTVQAFQGSGPGGQHRNKTATGVRLRLDSLNLEILCCEDRSAHVNRLLALKRMALAIALSQRESSLEPRIPFPGQKGRLSPENPKFPLFLAQVFDALEQSQGDLKPVADLWNLSPTALTRILFQEKSVLAAVQALRGRFGKGALRAPG